MTDELAKKLDRCKNAALRFVEGVNRFQHISPTYKKYGIASYKCRLKLQTLTLLASILRSNTPSYLRDHLNFRKTDGLGSKRASELDLIVKPYRTEYFAHSFRIGAVQLWNELPVEIRELHKAKYPISAFKSRLAPYIASDDPRLQ